MTLTAFAGNTWARVEKGVQHNAKTAISRRGEGAEDVIFKVLI
jgi:hypothetical protein